MQPASLHGWDLTPREAVAVQRSLSSRVQVTALSRAVHLVAGVDVSVRGDTASGAVVVLSYPGLRLEEAQVARRRVELPYIPGLLSFRECPVLLDAFARLSLAPELVLVDGQGLAHPRRLGLASHLGLLLDCPTVGCAKSRLCGDSEEPSTERGSFTLLRDAGETVGAVVRTRTNVRPVYVSVGHRITLDEAIQYVLSAGAGYRLPEPTRLAHQAAGGTLRKEPTSVSNTLIYGQRGQREGPDGHGA